MGRKLWPWAQAERIWLSGTSCEPLLNYKDRALTRLFTGASYTTTGSVFPSQAVVFHGAHYARVWSGLYMGNTYLVGWGPTGHEGGVRVCGLLSEIPLSTQTRPCNCCSESWGFLRRWSPDSPRWQGPPKICPQPGPWPFPCSLFQFSGQDSMVEWENGPGGRRSGVVSGELGSSRAPSLTGCVVSFLSQ